MYREPKSHIVVVVLVECVQIKNSVSEQRLTDEKNCLRYYPITSLWTTNAYEKVAKICMGLWSMCVCVCDVLENRDTARRTHDIASDVYKHLNCNIV